MTDSIGTSAFEPSASTPPSPETGNDGRRVRIGRTIVLAALGLAGAALLIVQVHATLAARRLAQYRVICRQLADDQDWAGLVAAANAWRTADPAEDDALVFRADGLVQQADYEGAVASLQGVRDSYQGATQALAACAEIQFADLNRVYDAERTWLRMLAINPRTDVAYQRLIYFYSMTLQRRKLVDTIRRAIERECEPPEAYVYLIQSSSLNFTDGASVLWRWKQNAPDDETLAVAHAVYAARNNEAGSIRTFGPEEFAGGESTPFEACARRFPRNLEIVAFAIEKAIADGNLDAVAKGLEQAPPEAATDSRFWRYRGHFLAGKQDYAEARTSLGKAIELNVFDWRNRLEISTVQRNLGETEPSRREGRLALDGKRLERALLESPNARELSAETIAMMRSYLTEVGDQTVLEGFFRRSGKQP